MSLEQLFAENWKLVHRTARLVCKWVGYDAEFGDFLAWGAEGLIEANSKFDPTKGTDFAKFAVYRIRGAMLDRLRRAKRDRKRQWLAQQVQQECVDMKIAAALDGTAIASTVPGAECTDDSWERRRALLASADLAWAISQLSERHRIFIEQHYFEGHSMAEVGRGLGISRSAASRLHQRAIKKLRQLLLAECGDTYVAWCREPCNDQEFIER